MSDLLRDNYFREKVNILIEDMSINRLRYLSVLKLPVQDDFILYFKTELLGETLYLRGHIVRKEEVHVGITAYEVRLIIQKKEQTILTKLLSAFKVLVENG